MKKNEGYHVGCSDLTGFIYVGKAKVRGEELEWISKEELTNEAIKAVAGHMLLKLDSGDDNCAYMFKTRQGRYVRLKLEVDDHKPEWLDEEADDEKRPD